VVFERNTVRHGGMVSGHGSGEDHPVKDESTESFVEKRASRALATRPPTGSISGIHRDAASSIDAIATPNPSRAWIYPLLGDFRQHLRNR
jgi:hypothetical protein